ncbi:hypothetical protein BHE74_00021435 [Ensete ventricosum]|nr:hypothetical protein BHE74_00021435 [Ensete ventricosum]
MVVVLPSVYNAIIGWPTLNKLKAVQIRSGDLVLRKAEDNDPTKARGKLAPNWDGPYRIVKAIREGTYTLARCKPDIRIHRKLALFKLTVYLSTAGSLLHQLPLGITQVVASGHRTSRPGHRSAPCLRAPVTKSPRPAWLIVSRFQYGARLPVARPRSPSARPLPLDRLSTSTPRSPARSRMLSGP